jgi:hypothetical protein
LPGTPIYRKVVKENLWWDGKSLKDLMFRSSLIKVDGFDNPKDFENFVNEANVKANSILKKTNPSRFKLKYGKDFKENSLIKQT